VQLKSPQWVTSPGLQVHLSYAEGRFLTGKHKVLSDVQKCTALLGINGIVQ